MKVALLLGLVVGGEAFVRQQQHIGSTFVRLRASEEDLKAAIMNAGPVTYNTLAGVEIADAVPDDVVFEAPISAKVMGRYDGEIAVTVSDGEVSAGGRTVAIDVVPDSMTLEDFYAGFEQPAPAWLSVSPVAGKLERKGGPATTLSVLARPPAGESFEGTVNLVVVLPDDIDKCYKLDVKVGADVQTSAYDSGSDEELD